MRSLLIFGLALFCLSTPAAAYTHHHHYTHKHYASTHKHYAKASTHKHYAKASTHKHHYAKAKSAHRSYASTQPQELKPSFLTTNQSRIVDVASRYIGSNPTGWSHNWCANFLDMALRQAGYQGGGNLAQGYASYGRPVFAQVGAIAVMPHHVGVVAEVEPGYVVLVSGNHSGKSGKRTVGLGRYPMSRILTFRMPT